MTSLFIGEHFHKKDYFTLTQSPTEVNFISNSHTSTQKMGENIARFLLPCIGRRKRAVVVGLIGELGSGKTTFAQGFAKGLGVKEKILSPTFLIMRSYQLAGEPVQSFYHVDGYRLSNQKELLLLGWKKITALPSACILVEWADKVKRVLPRDTIWISFRALDKTTRNISIS